MNLIESYKDTLDYSKDLLNSTTTKHDFSEILTDTTFLKLKFGKCAHIKVVNSDSVSALTEWSKVGKTAVLNMASYKRPGGGVINGARAQEECLFRCSNLGHVIPNSFYPLKDNELLWTKDAYFFKDVHYHYMRNVIIDVVTIAAPNLNDKSYSDMSNYEQLTKDKIRLMLSMAIKNNIDNIILGAWGCGVFGNKPNIMAKMFYDVLNEGYDKFNNVIFAIINDHNSVGNNYNEFKNIIK